MAYIRYLIGEAADRAYSCGLWLVLAMVAFGVLDRFIPSLLPFTRVATLFFGVMTVFFLIGTWRSVVRVRQERLAQEEEEV